MKLFARLFQRSRIHRELEDELRSHIQHRSDDLERSGLSRHEAERQARIEFGGYERVKEECREAAGIHFFETLLQDLRFGLRMLRKSPGFTAVAVTTLAIGICANSVVFSVMNAMVLGRLDLPQSERLYMVEYGKHHFEQSYPDYLDMRDRTRAFQGVIAFAVTAVGLDNGQGSLRTWAYETTGNYFDVLGVQPHLGQFFHASDEHGPDSAPYAVLSYAYWQNHYGADPGVVGRTVLVNKHPFTVLGVAPPQFRGTALFFSADMWLPLVNQSQIEGVSILNTRTRRSVWVIGRAKPGVNLAQINGDLESLAAWLSKTYPKDDDGSSFALARPELMGNFIGTAARAFVGGLMLLAALILLAACTNLGSLFAARAADRAKEVALRLALGSSRPRIIRQLLTEATMISLAGGAVGLAASLLLLSWIRAWQPVPEFPVTLPVNPDASVYLVALLSALLSGVLFGFIPVRQVLACNPYYVIKSGITGVGRRFTLRDLLLAAQIAICAVLVTASLVAVRGLIRSMHSNFAFRPDHVMLVNTDVMMAGYKVDQQTVIERRIRDAIAQIPGVTSTAYADTLPLNLAQHYTAVYAGDKADLRPSRAVAQTVDYTVSPGYFEAAGTTLLAGRTFTWHDDKSSPRVAVVNQQFARQVFGSVERALGGRFQTTRYSTPFEVVGVAENGKYQSLTEEMRPVFFSPILQSPSREVWFLVRSNGDPQQLAPALSACMRGLDRGLPFTVKTWHQELDAVLFPARIASVALGVLGSLGVLLAITGIFGMASYSVSKRLREFGIRIALGAQHKEVVRAALGRVFRLLAFGSAAGVLLGMAASKVLEFIVYQATPRDPMVLAGVLLTMLIVGLLAAWVPALRAMATDPSILLREE